MAQKTKESFFFHTYNWVIFHWALFLWILFALSSFMASLIVLEMAEALPDLISLHFPWKWRTPILPDKILDFCWLDQFWYCVAFDIITGTRGVGMHWLAYPYPSFNQSLDRRIMLIYLVQTHGGGWWSRGKVVLERCLYLVSNLTWKAINIFIFSYDTIGCSFFNILY